MRPFITITEVSPGVARVAWNDREQIVSRSYIEDRRVVAPSGCWEWTRSLSKGRAKAGWNKISVYASRLAYVLYVGDIPDGLIVCHTCDNGRCVNPGHLYAGSSYDNSMDAVNRGRAYIPSISGLAHYEATVPPEVIRAVVAEYLAGGQTQAQLAKKYGVGPTTIGRWVRAEARLDVGLPRVVVGRGSRIATGIKPCGTRAGWFRHRRDGERPCPECREANIIYFRAYRAKRKAAA